MASGVSVVIPNFNHAEQLRISLGAVVAQTIPADEVIVIDDASTDHSLAVIEAFARENPNITVLKNQKNQGVAATVNRGVAAARSKYIILASADERVETNMLELLLGAMETFPHAKLAISNFAEWYPEEGRVEIHGPDAELGLWYHGDDAPQYMTPERIHVIMAKGTIALQATTAIFERRALLDLGVYDPGLRWLGDWFTVHVLALRYGVVVVPETLAMFRRDAGSYSATGMSNRRAQVEVLDYLFSKLAEPEFQDIRDALIRSPAAMSPFMNSIIRYALTHLPINAVCSATVAWWLGQVASGRRPGFLRRLVHGAEPMAKIRNGLR